MSDTSVENEELVKLALAAKGARRKRLSRAMLARLIGERAEEGEEGEEDESDDEFAEGGGDRDRAMLRLLIGSRILRRRRFRSLLLAHLARAKRAEAEEEEDEGEDAEGEEGEVSERKIARLVIGSRLLKRRRTRNLLLAHLLREKGEAGEEEGEEDDSDEGDFGEGGGSKEHRLVRALIGSRVLRKRRTRKMLLAHLLHERDEDED